MLKNDSFSNMIPVQPKQDSLHVSKSRSICVGGAYFQVHREVPCGTLVAIRVEPLEYSVPKHWESHMNVQVDFF
jgi:hypothetical protein